MSAFEEMSNNDGRMGRETFALFVFNVPSIAGRYGFPPPPGEVKWSRKVCETWVLELFEKRGHEVALKLFLNATDEASFNRLIRTTIANELKDQAKATEAGKMRNRMRNLLTKEPDFIDGTKLYGSDPAWTLDSLGDAIFMGDWEDLLRTPALKAIEPIEKLNTAGPTSRHNIERLVGAARIILQTAGGAIRDQVLATALVKLFELDTPEIFLVSETDVQDTAGKPLEAPELRVAAIEVADAITSQLSRDEGLALLVLDQPITIAKSLLPHIHDLGAFTEEVRTKMQGLIDRADTPPGAMTLVLDWCSKLREL